MIKIIKKKFKQAWAWICAKFLLIKPGDNSFKGAAVGLLIGSVGLLLLSSLLRAINIRDPWVLVLGLLMVAAAVLSGMLSARLYNLLNRIPRWNKIAFFASIPLLFTVFFGNEKLLLASILIFSLLGATWFTLSKTGFKNLKTPKKVVFIIGALIGIAGLIMSIYYYSLKGLEMDEIENAALYSEVSIPHIAGESPATKGKYVVKTMSYGSGMDKHREEFGEEVTYKTESVNGVAFLDDWDGFGGWWREKYWGFDSKALPINGRVWYPEGTGPFPLVLVVHGNHSMQDYSDPGYDYLGELLASRGMILASVDENFINGSWSDLFGGLSKENDARGWLLLEHLKVWEEWNSSSDHAFAGKIDMSRISLIGHSRGGEAVAHAAMLNELDFYPDDATIPLGYHFNLQSIIAIAPVDGQYEPGGTLTKLKDINYFVFHGAQDADVSSFMGSMQFERVTFEDSSYHFKTGLYIQGANHGQFNTSWGDNDTGNPFKGLINLEQQLDEKSQQEIAKVYISAFLEITLRKKIKYLPLFMDARQGKNWLPETIYLNQFEDSNTKYLVDFNEDFDVITASNNGKIHGENLTVWRESEVKLNYREKGTRAVYLGWNYDLEDSLKEKPIETSVPDSLIATYTLDLPVGEYHLDSTSVFVFEMSESTESSNPKTGGKWVNENNNEEVSNSNDEIEEESKNENLEEKENEGQEGEEKEDSDEKEPEKPLDLSILLVDSLGNEVKFLLSDFSALQRQVKVQILKTDFLENDGTSEIVFQKFAFELQAFRSKNPAFESSKLKRIRFIFDQNEKGVVVMNHIGFMKKLNSVTTL
ncbi:alpha/beta hydrolase family protein [Algoriphagus machipongonensis]|uniref:Secreted protein n=1 Tax=Algoriphagus machipongonensis TaxID=388413 RepID=A3HUH5_9BACT|nr:hypothetical protein [Algoriphagus machipongonensis]EAZ81797.1 putative secreted protein [Algoriphagus machipongonensis]